MTDNPRVTVITAAMCQGNNLERVRDAFPDRFFDSGICESHAVAFAAGQAKVGLRPIVDIYSTFLQRSYDQIVPGSRAAESARHVHARSRRAGRSGWADASRRVRSWVSARVSEHGGHGAGRRSRFVANARSWRCGTTVRVRFAIRREPRETIAGERTPVEFGKSEILSWSDDGAIVCCGALLPTAWRRPELLRDEGSMWA